MSAISQQTTKRQRIEAIEQRLNAPLPDLFYQLHWGEDLLHREIGAWVDVARPTVTRWFSELGVPSQPSARITKTYLTSWAYITGQRTSKPRYVGPKRSSQEYRRNADVQFFKRWTPEMAYVLGYFAADGCLAVNSRGARYLHFDSIDRGQLETVRALLRSTHRISVKRQARGAWNTCYRLQIGSRAMFQDLVRLGLGLRKGCRLRLPHMPQVVLPDFVRGFFDGDGGVCYGAYARRSRPGIVRRISARFTSESTAFLRSLRRVLRMHAGMGQGSLLCYNTYARLSYSHQDCRCLFQYMYGNTEPLKKPLLHREYAKFLNGLAFCAHRGP